MIILALTNCSVECPLLAEKFLCSLRAADISEDAVVVYKLENPSWEFGTDNINRTSFEKLRIVSEHLQQGRVVLLCDIDIVMLKDPRAMLSLELETFEPVAQRGASATELGSKGPPYLHGFFRGTTYRALT